MKEDLSSMDSVKPDTSRFVLHRHDAKRAGLHWDLRFQVGDKLYSFAIPKGIPEAGDKHLALKMPDHDLSALDFEGNIPDGQYGAGSLTIEDKGPCLVYENLPGRIKVSFAGEKMSGPYVFINTRDKNNMWLIFKGK